MKDLQDIIKGITTKAALKKALTANGIKYRIDGESKDIWTGNIRIYKRYGEKLYTVQRWEKVKFSYSGTPVYFG